MNILGYYRSTLCIHAVYTSEFIDHLLAFREYLEDENMAKKLDTQPKGKKRYVIYLCSLAMYILEHGNDTNTDLLHIDNTLHDVFTYIITALEGGGGTLGKHLDLASAAFTVTDLEGLCDANRSEYEQLLLNDVSPVHSMAERDDVASSTLVSLGGT